MVRVNGLLHFLQIKSYVGMVDLLLRYALDAQIQTHDRFFPNVVQQFR